MTERIGFIGAGIMGRPMVRNLVKAGFPVTVFDIVPAAVEALVNEMFTTLVNEGRQEEDHSALLSHLERLSGHVIGTLSET